MTDPTLAEELTVFQRRWEQLTHVPETPRSLLNVIEYSLDSQRKAEVYVNRILRYFLDPDAPHGMGAEFLTTFLEALPDECNFQEDLYDLSDVHVDDQVPIKGGGDEHPDDESPGFVDLVVEVPNEWFLLVEIKFGAGENNLRGPGPSQTEYYYRATRIGGTRTDAYESGHYFLYLHPEDEVLAREEEFANLTWAAFVDVLEDFLAENAPRYPQRTVFQLRELADDVKEITGMTEYQENQRAKVELYLEHYEAITDVTETFDERWQTFTDEWPDLLADSLDERGYDPTGWNFLTYRDDWGHLFRNGWWVNQRTLETISSRIDESELRVSFVHRLEGNREDALGDHTLIFVFRNAGANDQTFIEEFNQRFDARRDDIERALPPTSEITGTRRNLIEARYEIRTEDHDTFFDAYLAALTQAFVDHTLNNSELVDTITEIYDDTIELFA